MSIDKNCLSCAGNQGDYAVSQEGRTPYFGVCKNGSGQVNVLPIDPGANGLFRIKDPNDALNRYNVQSKNTPPNRWTFNYSNTCDPSQFSNSNMGYKIGVNNVQKSCQDPNSGCSSCNQCIVQANAEKYESDNMPLGRPAYAKLDKTWLSQKPYSLE